MLVDSVFVGVVGAAVDHVMNDVLYVVPESPLNRNDAISVPPYPVTLNWMTSISRTSTEMAVEDAAEDANLYDPNRSNPAGSKAGTGYSPVV
jgi:hypothetical protein